MRVQSDLHNAPQVVSEHFRAVATPHEETLTMRHTAIAAAARELDSLREGFLNPEGPEPEELKKLTLTNLYNERPTWLTNAHKRLDGVLAAYGWPLDISDGEILARLMALNARRSGGDGT